MTKSVRVFERLLFIGNKKIDYSGKISFGRARVFLRGS